MQTEADRIYAQFTDHLERLEMAIYDACGANVGPEEFDEAAARASRAARALRGFTCPAFSRDRHAIAIRNAASIFGSYVRI